MNNDQISLANIEKTIGSKKILSDVSFSIGSNEIVGLLGPNGAGKTTAFYIAAGLIFPDQGKVFINNKDVRSMGFTPLTIEDIQTPTPKPDRITVFTPTFTASVSDL